MKIEVSLLKEKKKSKKKNSLLLSHTWERVIFLKLFGAAVFLKKNFWKKKYKIGLRSFCKNIWGISLYCCWHAQRI